MRHFGTLVIVLTVGLGAAGQAAAQQITSPYRFVERKQDLGIHVGWLETNTGKVGLGPEAAPVYGLQYALRLNDPMQFGAYAGVFSSERAVIDPSTDSGSPERIGTVTQDLVLLAARLQFNITGARTWNGLMPYIVAGIGLAIDLNSLPSCLPGAPNPQCSLDQDERFDFGNPFTGQIGIGVAWLWTERLGMRFTFHDNIWRFSAPDGFFDPDLELDPAPPETQWTNNLQVSAGLSYWF